MGTCQRVALPGRMVSTSLSLGTCLPRPSPHRQRPGATEVCTRPEADGNEQQRLPVFRGGRKSFPSTTVPALPSPLVPAEPSPHLCKQPAGPDFAEQCSVRERGVHGPCAWPICTHTTHGQPSAPGRGPFDLQRDSAHETHHVCTQCTPKVRASHRLCSQAFPASTTQQRRTLGPASSEPGGRVASL